MNPFKVFFNGLIAQGVGKTETPAESQNTTPGTYVVMPLRELIDALSLFEAQKSDAEHWVEICTDFVAYDCISVNFFMQGEESKE